MRTINKTESYKLTDEELCILTLQLGAPAIVIRATVELLATLTSDNAVTRVRGRNKFNEKLYDIGYKAYYYIDTNPTYRGDEYVDTIVYNDINNTRVLLVTELIHYMERLHAN